VTVLLVASGGEALERRKGRKAPVLPVPVCAPAMRVAAFEHDGDRLLLDRGRLRVAQIGDPPGGEGRGMRPSCSKPETDNGTNGRLPADLAMGLAEGAHYTPFPSDPVAVSRMILFRNLAIARGPPHAPSTRPSLTLERGWKIGLVGGQRFGQSPACFR